MALGYNACIPQPGMTLNAAKGFKNSNQNQTMIEYLHDCPTVEELSLFMFYIDLNHSIIGDAVFVLHVVSSSWDSIESPAALDHGILASTVA